MIEVRFAPAIKGISARWVKKVVAQTLELEKAKGRSVSVLLTGNREIRKLNREFLKHDYATDVIAFSALSRNFLGDVVVSAQMAKSVSKELGIPYKEELARYLVHGTLHLLGYEDKGRKKKALMHGRQEEILNVILRRFLPKNLKKRDPSRSLP